MNSAVGKGILQSEEEGQRGQATKDDELTLQDAVKIDSRALN